VYILINELSFVGQANTRYDVPRLMRTMMNVIKELESLRCSDPICTHHSFSQRRLSSDYTVYEWVNTKFPNDTDKEIREFFIIVVTKGPFIDVLLDQALDYHECFLNQQNVSSTSIAGAAYFEGVLISLLDAPEFEDERLPVKFSKDGETYQDKEVHNLTREGQSWNFVRPRYVPSPKHAPGGWGTLMDLDDEVAQSVLDNGVRYGRQIYGYHDGKYYEFQYDNVDGYHGYPVSKVHITVVRKMQSVGIL